VGTALTTYTGPCTITAPNTVIDAKVINCTLTIRATNVVITRSRIVGGGGGIPAVTVSGSATFTDTDIVTGVNSSGLDGSNFTATRVDISGGNRGGWCSDCTIQDSYIHGGRITGSTHASGLRADVRSRFIHNYVICDVANTPQGGGCSADLTGYPDFNAVRDWTITGNFFGATSGSYYCAYGGASGGKPYSNDPSNATNIQFRDNVFARGSRGVCGGAGPGSAPLGDYNKSKTGWVWSNNRYETGELIVV